MKRPILFAWITTLMFTSIFFTGCSMTTTLPPTQFPKCYSPHPTRSTIRINYPSQTDDLMPEIWVSAGIATTITIQGPLGVYTTTRESVQVELVPETKNTFDVRATFPASVFENRCIWQGEALSQKIVIHHSYEDEPTPPTNTPTPDDG